MSVKKTKKKKTDTIPVLAEKERRYLEDRTWYKAKFEKHTMNEGTYGPYVKLDFKILSGEDEEGNDAKGLFISAMENAEINPTSNLWEYVKVLAGEEPEVGDDIDLSAYYGTKVQVFAEDNNSKKAKKSGNRYQNVVALRDFSGKKKKSKKKSKSKKKKK